MSEKNVIRADGGENTIILVGNPNVGKSVIFGLLTGKYVTVSNYPGTSVELTRGLAKFDNQTQAVVDTPGSNGLIPHSEDEQVTRDVLIDIPKKTVIHVANAINLGRSLHFTIQLADMGLPCIIDLNMQDEAKSRGIIIDEKRLSKLVNLSVVSTVAVRRQGLDHLRRVVVQPGQSSILCDYGDRIESTIAAISAMLPEYSIAKRFVAISLVCNDQTMFDKYVKSKITPLQLDKIEKLVADLVGQFDQPIEMVIHRLRNNRVNSIIAEVLHTESEIRRENQRTRFHFDHPIVAIVSIAMLCFLTSWTIDDIGSLKNLIWMPYIAFIYLFRRELVQSIEKTSAHRYYGWFFLLGILGFIYLFVGVFGAGISVDFLENTIFGQYINPFFTSLVDTILPFPLAHEILVDETYGIFTVAITYAIAIILPIVGFFFLVFGLLEDSGYLPRLAVMVNKIFKTMGLNGKAVLPMVLGLGCDTMATLTARILSTKKERLIVTILLALGIPCSAQLGVILGMLGSLSIQMVMIMVGVIVGVLILVGYLSALILPGKSSSFIQELPPIRIPEFGNILIKTLARIEWYLIEAVPLFVLGTFGLYLLYKLEIIGVIERLAAPIVVNFLDLPIEATKAFIIGFLRRDYAATELFVMSKNQLLSPTQVLVGMVTITLFVPCLANFFIMIKERGLKQACAIVAFIFPTAFLVGGTLNHLLRFFGVGS